MSKIKLVAFDLDGTIGDTIPLCIRAFKKAVMPYIGYELSDDDVIQTFGNDREYYRYSTQRTCIRRFLYHL